MLPARNTHKEKNQFIFLMRSHFSLIAKNCVGLGTHTLYLDINSYITTLFVSYTVFMFLLAILSSGSNPYKRELWEISLEDTNQNPSMQVFSGKASFCMCKDLLYFKPIVLK